MSPEGLPRLPLPSSAYATHDKQGHLASMETLQSPSGSYNESHSESELSTSFRSSQYRQSAVLELGSAVPMEIGYPNGPREIQIRRPRSSGLGMDDVLHGMHAHRDILRRLSQESSMPTSYLDEVRTQPNQSQSPGSSYGDRVPSWSVSTPLSSHRHSISDPASSKPHSQKLDIPVSPLKYPPSASSKRLDLRQALDSQRNSEVYLTAMESSGEDQSDDDRSLSFNATAPEASSFFTSRTQNFQPDNIFDPRNLSNTSWQAASQEERSLRPIPPSSQTQQQNRSKLHQTIGEEDNIDISHDLQHSRSISEPAHLRHPLPSPPAETIRNSDNAREFEEPTMQPLHDNVPNQILRKLSESEHSSEHLVRQSSRRRGYDTIAPHIALKAEEAKLDSDVGSRLHDQDRETRTKTLNKEKVQLSLREPHHRKSHSDNTGESRHRSRRRNFTKKSIEDLMKEQPQIDIEDIGLPGPERRLLERFIDSLSKLSIEVQMDERKREEGLRRLNNALRALEGWI